MYTIQFNDGAKFDVGSYAEALAMVATRFDNMSIHEGDIIDGGKRTFCYANDENHEATTEVLAVIVDNRGSMN